MQGEEIPSRKQSQMPVVMETKITVILLSSFGPIAKVHPKSCQQKITLRIFLEISFPF